MSIIVCKCNRCQQYKMICSKCELSDFELHQNIAPGGDRTCEICCAHCDAKNFATDIVRTDDVTFFAKNAS